MAATDDPAAILSYAYYWGKKFIENKQTARSVRCLHFVVKNYPAKRADFYYLLGELYGNLGYQDEAVRNYTMATKEDPPNIEAFIRLAQHNSTTDPSKSIDILTLADSRLPDNSRILFPLALIYSGKEQFKKAVTVFDRIASNMQESKDQKLTPDFYLYYGTACERSDQFEKAEKVFETCLELYPDNHQILNYIAYMWAERGEKLDKAMSYVKRALKHEPENGAYTDTLGWIYYKQKEYEKALIEIQKARTQIEDDPVIGDHLGDTYAAMRNEKKAVLHWKESFLLDPANKAVADKLRSHGINIRKLRKEAKKRIKKAEQEKKTDKSDSE